MPFHHHLHCVQCRHTTQWLVLLCPYCLHCWHTKVRTHERCHITTTAPSLPHHPNYHSAAMTHPCIQCCCITPMPLSVATPGLHHDVTISIDPSTPNTPFFFHCPPIVMHLRCPGPSAVMQRPGLILLPHSTMAAVLPQHEHNHHHRHTTSTAPAFVSSLATDKCCHATSTPNIWPHCLQMLVPAAQTSMAPTTSSASNAPAQSPHPAAPTLLQQ